MRILGTAYSSLSYIDLFSIWICFHFIETTAGAIKLYSLQILKQPVNAVFSKTWPYLISMFFQLYCLCTITYIEGIFK